MVAGRSAYEKPRSASSGSSLVNHVLVIALGGSMGAVARFLTANWVYGLLGRSFPYGTLVVNVLGCYLMGVLTELLLQRLQVASEYRAAILVGFLGAYTTFSTFAFETLFLYEEGGAFKALLNIVLSVSLCILAVWLGLVSVRLFFTGGFESVQRLVPGGLRIGAALGLLLMLELIRDLGFRVLGLEWTLVGLLQVGLMALWALWFAGFVARGEAAALGLNALMGRFLVMFLLSGLVIRLANLMGNWIWRHSQ